MNNLDLILQVNAIAREAGAAILGIYNNNIDIEVAFKSDDSPLTKADQAANDLIVTALTQLNDFPIISEENQITPYLQRKDYTYYWLVDPLDGTKEFIKRNGEFTVNIALIHIDKVVAGVVYAPCLDELYYAAAGHGAYRERAGITTRLAANRFTMQDKNLQVVSSRSHLNTETEAFISQLDGPNLVTKGSSLKFLMVANGEADIYPRAAPTMEWDTAAAQIIVEEAGGHVYQFGTKLPVRYNKENLLNPYFVVYANVINL